MVGFVFDKKLTWKPMLNKVCSKGRQAIGAMFRLKSLLGCSDLAILFKTFVRSTLEYGNLEYFAAAPGYLQRLDRIQASAERLCGHSFTALGDRRKAAAFGLVCKLLDVECIDQLQQIKLRINKPQYLTFPCKKWIRILTRFLEVPCQGGSSETLS